MKVAIGMFVLLISMNGVSASENYKSLADVQRELYGTNVFEPSQESLLGQYLAQTQAATVRRSFLTAPAGNQIPQSKMGPQKMVVAVSPDTFSNFNRLFSGKNFLYLYYVPNGGMIAGFEGMRGNYILSDTMRYTTDYTLMIPILLDSDEAASVANYFSFARKRLFFLGSPWYLLDENRQPYSATSAYQGCTNWFGGIPLGSKKVAEYIFPRGDTDPSGQNPFRKPLTNYSLDGASWSEGDKAALREIYQVPGRELLGEVLDPMAHRRGEFTNVGWIAYTLLGSIGLDRVPLIFRLVPDELQTMAEDFPVQIYAYFTGSGYQGKNWFQRDWFRLPIQTH